MPLINLYLMKLFVDEVTNGVTSGATVSTAFGDVTVIIAIMAGVALFNAAIGVISGWINLYQSQLVTEYMQDMIHAQSIAVDMEYYENAEFYNKLQRAQREAPMRPLQILNNLTQLIRSTITLTGITGLLLTFHWSIGIVLLLTVLPSFFVQLHFSKTWYHWQRERTEIQRLLSYFNWLLVGHQYAKEVRLFDLGEAISERFREIRLQLRQERISLTLRQSLFGFAAQLVTLGMVYGSYAFVAYQTLHGSITLGGLVMYYQALQRGQGYLGQFLKSIAGLYEDTLFVEDLYEFLNLEPRIVSPSNPRPVPQPARNGIAFKRVSFDYPLGTRQALETIDLTISPGEKIALVGENGSGKTTLIKLLCRLYDPDEGCITIDGIDLREFDVMAWRSQLGVILQDYAHYSLSVRDNIRFGNTHTALDQAQLDQATQEAGAHEVIARLPKGYETILGKLFQEGEELSIGEWQKIALARAFVRNAQIIILDEPTSAMDARSEYQIFERIRDFTEGHTVILISHRFSTVRMADRIAVMEQGRIVELGSHDELLRRNGKYAQMFRMQAEHYT